MTPEFPPPPPSPSLPPSAPALPTARRQALRAAARALGLFALAGVIPARQARAQVAAWDAAFAAHDAAAALRALGAQGARPDELLLLDAPEVWENGAVVPFSVSCRLPGVSMIALLVERNPGPLAAVFRLPPGTEPFVATRLKMAESSPVHALAQAEDGFFLAQRFVRVVQGGCAG